MKRIICEGNKCNHSVYTTNGCAGFTIMLTNTGEDECSVIYEDGLYKLIKNQELVMAATSVLIRYYDRTNE